MAITGVNERAWHSYLWQGCLGIFDRISHVGGYPEMLQLAKLYTETKTKNDQLENLLFLLKFNLLI